MDPNTLKMIFGAAQETPPVSISFFASSYYLNANATAVIEWSVENAVSLSINNGIGNVASSASAQVTGSNVTRTYILTALGFDGQTSTSQLTIQWKHPCPYYGTSWEWAC